MTEKIRFTKMHGCGNDYIYINMMEHAIADPQAAAIAWSDRHKGIGSDGLVLIDRSPVPEADFSMRIFNADGSEAMMCGNASRCIGKYLYERGLTTKTEIRLLTLSGVKILSLQLNDDIVESVTVDMLEPVFENTTQYIASRSTGRGTFVSAILITSSLPTMSIRWVRVERYWSITQPFLSAAISSLPVLKKTLVSALVYGSGEVALPWLVAQVLVQLQLQPSSLVVPSGNHGL